MLVYHLSFVPHVLVLRREFEAGIRDIGCHKLLGGMCHHLFCAPFDMHKGLKRSARSKECEVTFQLMATLIRS